MVIFEKAVLVEHFEGLDRFWHFMRRYIIIPDSFYPYRKMLDQGWIYYKRLVFMPSMILRRNDTHHDDIQHNDTQLKYDLNTRT
jgi:hypothetical protein